MFSLTDISIILVRPRFPENIGMAARAAANMGVTHIILVEPERWDFAKAAPLATGKGLAVLSSIRVKNTLAEALEGHTAAFGCTARTGGWRKSPITPREAVARIAQTPRQSGTGKTALVFGPEDTGLENTETSLCTHLVTIPTDPESSSLNLAQAVLIMVYECFIASLEHARLKSAPKERDTSRIATLEEQELLFAKLRESLIHIGFLPENNPAWFMQPIKRFLRRAVLRKYEFDLFMGICRKLMRLSS